ncbi:MAG: hypothetical protein ACR652_23075 [Methylocystis sp.]|uniref:hypothetical protein n=1 Tax=Methylocystis sp. TaxID=1911079 RepID=UPI003DA54682
MKAPTKKTRRTTRPRTKAAPPPEPLDPVAILEAIARNPRLKPTPRVAAARELLRYRTTLAAQAANSPEAKKDAMPERIVRDLNAKALALLTTKGSA